MVALVGSTIPEDTQHAVSVSLPTWKDNVAYEEGQEWVVSQMKTGYPRFFVHLSIQKLAKSVLARYGHAGEACMLFPSQAVAARCRAFIKQFAASTPPPAIRIVALTRLAPQQQQHHHGDEVPISSDLYAVLFPSTEFPVAKQFWQHSGDGVSSRRAEFCQRELDEGVLVEKETAVRPRGPKRYSRVLREKTPPPVPRAPEVEIEAAKEGEDTTRFVEERFGRNLDTAFVDSAKLALRKRITGTLRANVGLKDALEMDREGEGRGVEGLTEDHVYLYPTGMSSIFNAHRVLMAARGPMKSVSYGFPYVDTLKILQKFGPGCHFYGFGSQEDLDDLEAKLAGGEKLLALFCEFPGNPLLVSPNLRRIRALADRYDFAVVVDETIGNFLNVHVLPYADVVVSSLTKVFSGDSNVMGGSMVLNPRGRYYQRLRDTLAIEYEDNHWAEDVLVLERNSRDFVTRIERINHNAETICELLQTHARIKHVYYPKTSPTREYYDDCRCPNGGYGGLLSITFHDPADAVVFFDNLDTAKGPSLGTNFTLSSPYVLLAHFQELEWSAQFGVEAHLVRFSVGLEETTELVGIFEKALRAVEARA